MSYLRPTVTVAALWLCLIGVALPLRAQPPAGDTARTSTAPVDTVYQCSGPDGETVLQNAPCPNRTDEAWHQGPVAATPEAGSTVPPAAAEDRLAAGTAAASGAVEAGSAPARTGGEPELGMSTAQVQAILGPPLAVTQEEVVQGRVVTWIYGDARTLQFDTSGNLSAK